MKKWVFAGVIGCFLIAAPTLAKKYYNTPFLEKVERTPTAETETTVEQKTTYKDNLITIITWNPAPLGFYFELVNESASPLRIIWEECYLHDVYSKYTIVHGGIRDLREMPPTRIKPGKTLKDFLYPSAYVRYVRGRYSEMRVNAIYKGKLKEKDIANNSYTPQTFRAALALDVGENRFTYTFHFKTELVEK